MSNDKYRDVSVAIMQETASKLEQHVQQTTQYKPEVAKQLRDEMVERMKGETRGKLDVQAERIKQEAAEAQERLRAYRFPLSTGPAGESAQERLAREQAQLQAVETAYVLPLYDAGAVEVLFKRGLRHAAFEYVERCFRAATTASDQPRREAWQNLVGDLLRKDTQHAELMRAVHLTERAAERIDAFSRLSDQGVFTPALMDPAQQATYLAHGGTV